MNLLKKFLNHIRGEQQESAGEKAGRDKARSEQLDEAKKQALKKISGEHLLSELDELKKDIGGENCPKCRRTERTYCKKCQRTLKGLDTLAGRIAKKYTDRESRWKK